MIALYKRPVSGTGGGGPETDPVAVPLINGHKTAVDPHGDRAHGDSALTTHTGGVDPHGDRGYTDSRFSALSGGTLDAALDTLAEIDAQLRSDESGAAAMQAAINARALVADLQTEIARAQAAEAANTAAINLRALITDLQAETNARIAGDKYVPGLIGDRPTPAAFGPGLYFATDDDGGTLWRSDGVQWQQITVGLNWASGTQLAFAPFSTGSPVVNSTAASDVDPALTITVPASAVPVKVRGCILGQQATGGSAAVGTFNQLAVALTDASNTSLAFDTLPAIQASLASHTWYHAFQVQMTFPAPFAGGTYKLRTYLTAALASGWTASLLATAPTWPKAFLEAVAQ